MTHVAEASGHGAQGAALLRDAELRIERIAQAVRSPPRRARPRVVALEWLDPVYVAGHWTPQLIELAGGEDVLGMPGEPSQTVSWEAVAAAEPEVVVVMPCGYDASARAGRGRRVRRSSSPPSRALGSWR